MHDFLKFNPQLLGFGLAIVSAVCLGIGTFIYKLSGRNLSPSNTTFFYYLFSFLLAFVVWLATPNRGEITKNSLLWPALMALFLCASVWTFSSATRVLDMSTASTVRGLSFLPTVLLSMVIFQERPSAKSVIAMMLVAVAVILLGWDAAEVSENVERNGERNVRSGQDA